jgi:hypothetical protein
MRGTTVHTVLSMIRSAAASNPAPAAGSPLRRARLDQFLHDLAQQLGIKNVLCLRKTRECHRLPATVILHPAKLARCAERAHRARVEDSQQKQSQIFARSQPSQPVEFAPPRLDARSRPLQ